MTRMVQCVKLGREAEGLDRPPYPGDLGKRIFENVSKEAWKAWMRYQTMLVNENRLNLAEERARMPLMPFVGMSMEQARAQVVGQHREVVRLAEERGQVGGQGIGKRLPFHRVIAL